MEPLTAGEISALRAIFLEGSLQGLIQALQRIEQRQGEVLLDDPGERIVAEIATNHRNAKHWGALHTEKQLKRGPM